jgi:hypothetical protein
MTGTGLLVVTSPTSLKPVGPKILIFDSGIRFRRVQFEDRIFVGPSMSRGVLSDGLVPVRLHKQVLGAAVLVLAVRLGLTFLDPTAWTGKEPA